MSPQSPTDTELWERVRDGDRHAFGTLFDRHARTVYNYCFRRTADWTAAEDLTSVVFLETWRRRDRVRMESASLLPWLYGVAANVLHNHRRGLRRHRDALARLPLPETTADDADDTAARLDAERQMRAVLASIDRLSRRDREILTLSAWEGLSYQEIATALGIRVGTVRSRLARARERLRADLGLPAEPVPPGRHREGGTTTYFAAEEIS
ncbi:sigma-70 family RNA polymerase sigma factor [Actinomadura kijaniata]|uniref:RNA polymerase sigma-70 factor (ECF subfamily) n=1 Tax=Actinomadura namibiensis TaxID=182080 RepID=A0A7W3QKR5_ACTNM|nr:RNA polymerase sigma factor [Actinomadura namibiensis]MBA8950695.1 RNA polymerase sigma-70 factor (ECF subfamily) [Actinomadura namibiensis]